MKTILKSFLNSLGKIINIGENDEGVEFIMDTIGFRHIQALICEYV